MKRIIACMLAVLCALLWTGCNDAGNAAVTQRDGKTYVVLPVSGEELVVPEDCAPYAERIDGALLRAAEEAIAQEIAAYPENSGFYVGKDDEGHLLLCVEAIAPIERVPETGEDVVDGGCGIDHEHRLFSERITE